MHDVYVRIYVPIWFRLKKIDAIGMGQTQVSCAPCGVNRSIRAIA